MPGCWADHPHSQWHLQDKAERGSAWVPDKGPEDPGTLFGTWEGKRPTATFLVSTRSCTQGRWLDACPDSTQMTNPSLLFPISLIFGALTVVTGIIGVILGAEASRRYKKVNPRAEPLICASSLLVAAPCLYLALTLAPTTFLASYVSEGPFGGGQGRVVGNSCSIQASIVCTLCLSLLLGRACYPHFTDE